MADDKHIKVEQRKQAAEMKKAANQKRNKENKAKKARKGAPPQSSSDSAPQDFVDLLLDKDFICCEGTRSGHGDRFHIRFDSRESVQNYMDRLREDFKIAILCLRKQTKGGFWHEEFFIVNSGVWRIRRVKSDDPKKKFLYPGLYHWFLYDVYNTNPNYYEIAWGSWPEQFGFRNQEEYLEWKTNPEKFEAKRRAVNGKNAR